MQGSVTRLLARAKRTPKGQVQRKACKSPKLVKRLLCCCVDVTRVEVTNSALVDVLVRDYSLKQELSNHPCDLLFGVNDRQDLGSGTFFTLDKLSSDDDSI